MKLKKILSDIKEEWHTETQSSMDKEYREIFKNPTQSDIRDIIEYGGDRLGDDIRFIADRRSQNVYATSADVFHQDMFEEIDEFTDDVKNRIFSGIGDWNGRVIKISYFSDLLIEDETGLYVASRNVVEGKYDWMERYNFDLSDIKDVAEENVESLEKRGVV